MLVSAAIARGVPHRIILAWHFGAFEMVVSYELLYELEAVLLRDWFRRKLTYADVLEYVTWLSDGAMLAEGGTMVRVSRDPDDDYLLALARSSGADCLVSGDPDLSGMQDEGLGVRLLDPRSFYEMFVARTEEE